MSKESEDTPKNVRHFPSYDPRLYPEGVDDFLRTFPPERRRAALAAVVETHSRLKAEKTWVGRQVQGMLEVPDILYKYVPCTCLEDGCPLTLRATQPSALNDVMEGNIRTSMESKMDPDKWYAIIFDALRRIFGDDSFGAEELERRKRLYGDPRVSTIIRAYLSRFVGVVSFSADPLNPAMWAYYAQNTGFVIGYRTSAMRARGLDLRRVLYLELAPVYTPTRDDIVRLQFVDEERRDQDIRDGHAKPDIKPLLSADADLLELRQDWNELAKVLFIKGQAWSHEQEVRLLVNLHNTRVGRPPIIDGLPLRVFDVPTEAIEEVYVGFNTPQETVDRIKQIVGVGVGTWKLKRADSHAYRMEVTSTGVRSRRTDT